jgi:hypothetical protein
VVTNLDATVKNVRKDTERIPEITAAVADGAKEVPGVLRQTQASMREMQRLVEAMQRHWLLRKYVNHTNPPPMEPWPDGDNAVASPAPWLESPKTSAR